MQQSSDMAEFCSSQYQRLAWQCCNTSSFFNIFQKCGFPLSVFSAALALKSSSCQVTLGKELGQDGSRLRRNSRSHHRSLTEKVQLDVIEKKLRAFVFGSPEAVSNLIIHQKTPHKKTTCLGPKFHTFFGGKVTAELQAFVIFCHILTKVFFVCPLWEWWKGSRNLAEKGHDNGVATYLLGCLRLGMMSMIPAGWPSPERHVCFTKWILHNINDTVSIPSVPNPLFPSQKNKKGLF